MVWEGEQGSIPKTEATVSVIAHSQKWHIILPWFSSRPFPVQQGWHKGVTARRWGPLRVTLQPGYHSLCLYLWVLGWDRKYISSCGSQEQMSKNTLSVYYTLVPTTGHHRAGVCISWQKPREEALLLITLSSHGWLPVTLSSWLWRPVIFTMKQYNPGLNGLRETVCPEIKRPCAESVHSLPVWFLQFCIFYLLVVCQVYWPLADSHFQSVARNHTTVGMHSSLL